MHAISSHNNPHRQDAGFTLVEMLAVAPIIVLVLATFIGFMITMTGEILALSAKGNLMQLANASAEQLEQDVKRSVMFPSQSFTPTSPQGFNPSASLDANGSTEPFYNGSQAFTLTPINSPNIILRQVATDKNPLDPTRKIVRKNGPYACTDAANVDKNEPYLYDVVYFYTSKLAYNQAGTPYYAHRVFRRVLFDSSPANQPCTTPWQKPSCAKGQTAAICKADDEEWATNGYESGISVPVAGWYYADIPQPKVGTDSGEVAQGQQWIHPYNDGTPNCSSNMPPASNNPADPQPIDECEYHAVDPYSPTTGKNAKSLNWITYWSTVVAGKQVVVARLVYAVRGGS